MINQMIIDIKTQFNMLKFKINKAIGILTHSPKTYILVEHRDSTGKLLYHNAAALINQGEESMIKDYFQNVSIYIPSGFKVALATDASFSETSTTFTEVAGTGYAEISVAHNNTDWTASKPIDSWQVLSKNCVFTAGGTWTIAKHVVLLATLNAVDTLIAYASLTADRTLYNGDTLTVSIIMSLE